MLEAARRHARAARVAPVPVADYRIIGASEKDADDAAERGRPPR